MYMYIQAHQPVGLREWVAKACTVVKEVKQQQEHLLTFMLPSSGDHRHCTDHLRHSHQGARAARDDRGSGRSSPTAATSGGQAAHHGH